MPRAERQRENPNAKRGRCCHRPRLRFRPGSLDPGRFLQASTKQAPLPPVGRLSGEPATILRTSFRRTGDCPFAALSHRANPASRPSVSLRANPSRPVRSPAEQAPWAAFRGSFARRLRFRRTPEKWVRLKVSPLPRASFRLPHQSVPGLLPEGSRPDRHWRRLGRVLPLPAGLPRPRKATMTSPTDSRKGESGLLACG